MLEDLKDEIDLESFFEAMGAKKLKPTSNGYIMCCLAPDHNDSSPSFHYRTDNHKFNCYGCDFHGDIIDIVAKVKGIRFRQAINWLRSFCGWSSDTNTKELEALLDRRAQVRGVQIKEPTRTVQFPYGYEPDIRTAPERFLEYIKKRGWSVTLLHQYEAGFCLSGRFKERIILPIKSTHGKLLSYAARDITGEADEKYLYPKNSALGESIWGLHCKQDGVPIFVEGIADALRLRQYGFNSYACLGNQLGEVKLELIRSEFKKHEQLVVIPDNDNGGSILLKWFQKLIHSFDIQIGLIQTANDVDELGKQEINDIMGSTLSIGELIAQRYQAKKSKLVVTEVEKLGTDPPKPSFDYWLLVPLVM